MHPDTQVERVLAGCLGHVLIARNTSRLKSLGRHVLLLPRHEVHAVGELLNALPLHADIVDADLGVGDTAAVAGLGVRLVLDLPVAEKRRGNKFSDVSTKVP